MTWILNGKMINTVFHYMPYNFLLTSAILQMSTCLPKRIYTPIVLVIILLYFVGHINVIFNDYQ